MISSQITPSGGSVWCLPSCLSGPHGPWRCGTSQERTIIRCRVQLKSNIYEWNVCVRNRLCLIIWLFFITSRATWIIIIWFELSIFSLPSMKSLLHYHDEDENTQFKYHRWGETSLTLFTTWEGGLGHLTWVTFWNFAGIWSKTPPLAIHKSKSLLSFPPGRPQDFKLDNHWITIMTGWNSLRNVLQQFTHLIFFFTSHPH